MAENKVIIQYGHVEWTDDELDGMRIKVRLNQDRVGTTSLPYAFPLLPKTFQSMPKKGEGVFVFTMELSNNESQRFYLGPIISQPQYFNHDNYYILGGQEFQQAASLLKGAGNAAPKGGISTYDKTKHAFPDRDSVAVIGRDAEDIEIKEGEIDIRCGIRGEAPAKNENIFGKVVFNSKDPAYIQLKYNQGGLCGGNETKTTSIANIVAGKINLVSTNDEAYTECSYDSVDGSRTLLSKYEQLMKDLHKVPWGDKLIEFLDLFRNMYAQHTHPNPLLPPFPQFSEQVIQKDLESLLSKDVRVS